MAARGKHFSSSVWLLLLLNLIIVLPVGETAEVPQTDINDDAEEKVAKSHKIDSVELIMFMSLLVLTILTIWVMKHLRLRWIHETGLATIYGIAIGAIIKFASKEPVDLRVFNSTCYDDSGSAACDSTDEDVILRLLGENNSIASNYTCHRRPRYTNALESRSTFDPEIFFYVILPPIIFHAGYSMKRRHFFRNFGAIITFAFIGTLVSAFVIAGILYGLGLVIPRAGGVQFPFLDCLWYGSIISATDPVTVLAIFNDLHVDVDLYALVFGESVLNDAVAIVLARAVKGFSSTPDQAISAEGVLKSLGTFMAVFLGSFGIGAMVGCINALITKMTRLHDFPVLESSLFVIVSYLAYLIAEALTMSGIVSVLFCGIFQAHYTFNNLSEESKRRTKELMELLNFLFENFVFVYIGITVFTREFQTKDWNVSFIFCTILAMTIGRFVNVYPLSFLLNLGRKNKIHFNLQHMMMFSGLRGAIAFALAIENAAAEGTTLGNILLTTTVVIVILTVVGCGALSMNMLQWLKIRVGVDDQTGQPARTAATTPGQTTAYGSERTSSAVGEPSSGLNTRAGDDTTARQSTVTTVERVRMVRWWNRFDNTIMKPILTNYRMTLSDNFPESRCCGWISKAFTTPEQFQACASQYADDEDSDVDLIIGEDELTLFHPASDNQGTADMYAIDAENGDLGIGEYGKQPFGVESNM